MFREMRRKGQQISQEECSQILLRAKTGILGVHGDDGYPYTVPVNFVYTPGKDGQAGTIGFHCAKTGHKIDSIRRNEKVSFTVVDRDEIMPRERTTKYCSVIVFGRARFLQTEEELRRAANAVGAKYSAGFEDLYKAETEDAIRRGTLCCVEITIDHMTGKIGKELMKERNLAGRAGT
jgi:nitroimidazol reductase NimA-like FMN-containing flavoprotein (pyridoxamine 5'-phosphate oxidase superfamily)